MMALFQLFVGLIAAIANCCCQEKLTNIDYLGLGYDIVYGNPHSDLRDPGFREAVFDLDYSTQSVSSDGKWLIPDNVQALQTFSCGYETDSSEVLGTSSYSDSLEVDASVYGKAWFVKFSASADYQKVREGTTVYRSSYVSAVARCLLYQASIKALTEFKVTEDFSRAVNALPTTRNDASYLKFISVYGTHFASSLDMGSKAVVRSEFKQAAWTSMQQSKFNFKAGAHASFLGFTGGLDVSTATDQQLAASFESNRSSMAAYYMGSRPSSDGRWETWMESTIQSPYPIAYVLRPLTDVLTNQYFPNISASVLEAKQSILNSTYDTYCSNTPGCGVPQADNAAVRLEQQKAAIINTQLVKCPPGLTLLSCGIANLAFSTTAESKRVAVPYDSETCECFANNGLTCIPWCTNSVKDIEIRVSSFIKGDFQVNCPAQSKVVGCAADQRAAAGDEWDKSFYPLRDGSGCTCSLYNGGQCRATCATNVQNYEVLTQYGRGSITVQCSPNNFVLGCGIRNIRTLTADQFHTYYTSSLTSCQCNHSTGATCYAICGQFM